MRMKTFRVSHRRRREGRTDYRQRLRLLKSGKPRLVIRKSSGGVVCQVIEYHPRGDRLVASAGQKELASKGWKAGTGNLPAAYLTGLLCGTKARKRKVREAVLDAGLHPSTKGSRIYAALKGFTDSGVSVPHSGGILPPDERIRGSHIEKYAESIKSGNAEKYSRHFSGYSKAGIRPEAISRHFEDIRKKLLN
jgi:large subunit ribosomal protein L18